MQEMVVHQLWNFCRSCFPHFSDIHDTPYATRIFMRGRWAWFSVLYMPLSPLACCSPIKQLIGRIRLTWGLSWMPSLCCNTSQVGFFTSRCFFILCERLLLIQSSIVPIRIEYERINDTWTHSVAKTTLNTTMLKWARDPPSFYTSLFDDAPDCGCNTQIPTQVTAHSCGCLLSQTNCCQANPKK